MLNSLPKTCQVLCHISKVDVEKEVLRVTMLRGGGLVEGCRRKKVQSSLQPGQVIVGKVKKIKQEKNEDGWIVNAGAFVDIGAQYDAFLQSSGELPPAGQPVTVRILSNGLDAEQLHVRRRIDAELVQGEPVGNLDDILKTTEQQGSSNSIRIAVFLEDDNKDEDEEPFDDKDDRYAYLDDY